MKASPGSPLLLCGPSLCPGRPRVGLPSRPDTTVHYSYTSTFHMHSLQAGRWGWRWATSERECVAGAAIWLCLSASEVEELQNPLLIARPAGFRCLARYLGPSGRSRVSQGLTHRLRDDLGGRRSCHAVDRLMGLIRQFHWPPDVRRRDKFPGLLRVGACSPYFSSVVSTWETDVIRMAPALSPLLARKFPRGSHVSHTSLSIMLTIVPPCRPRVRAAPPARRLVCVSTLPVLLLRVM